MPISFFYEQLDTFKSYLRQNKQLTSDIRTAHQQFCKAIKMLENIRNDFIFWKKDKTKREKVRQQTEKLNAFLFSDKVIAEKAWLQEQNNILINKFLSKISSY